MTQASVLVARLHAVGVNAAIDASPGGLTGFDIHVAERDLDRARTELAGLAGQDTPLGLLDARRLLPALLALAAIVALLVFLVKLVT